MTYENTPSGAGHGTVEAKLADFSQCVQEGQREDAMGHLFDLMHYLCPYLELQIKEPAQMPPDTGRHKCDYGTEAYFTVLWMLYGQHPVQLRGHHGEETETRKAADGAAG